MTVLIEIKQEYEIDGAEPMLSITPDGADITMNAWSPVMDKGCGNAALISLFTEPNWWGNHVLEKDNRIGLTDFDTLTKEPVTRESMIAIEKEAYRALDWMRNQDVQFDAAYNGSAMMFELRIQGR